jgi:hypothetical protein
VEQLPEAKVVEEAIKLLEKHGWCQESFEDKHGRICLGEALVRAAQEGPGPSAMYNSISSEIKNKTGNTPIRWNDEKGRTDAQVIEFLKTLYAQPVTI